MFARFGCLLLLAPLVEILLLVQGIRWWGGTPILLEVLLTAFLGGWLLRGARPRTLAELQASAARGEAPATTLLDRASFLTAGFLLFLPGLAGDLLGLALLLPPTRKALQGWAMARLSRQLEQGHVHVTFMGMGSMGQRPGPGTGAGPGPEPWPDLESDPRKDLGPDPRRHPRGDLRIDRGPGSSNDEDPDPPPRPGEIIQR